MSAFPSWNMRSIVTGSNRMLGRFTIAQCGAVARPHMGQPLDNCVTNLTMLHRNLSVSTRLLGESSKTIPSSSRNSVFNHFGLRPSLQSQKQLAIDGRMLVHSSPPCSWPFASSPALRGRCIHTSQLRMAAEQGDESDPLGPAPPPPSATILAAASLGMCVAIAASNALVRLPPHLCASPCAHRFLPADRRRRARLHARTRRARHAVTQKRAPRCFCGAPERRTA